MRFVLLAVFLLGCAGGGSDVVVPAGCPDPSVVVGKPLLTSGDRDPSNPRACDDIAPAPDIIALGDLVETVADLDNFETKFPNDGDLSSESHIARVTRTSGVCSYEYRVDITVSASGNPTCRYVAWFTVSPM